MYISLGLLQARLIILNLELFSQVSFNTTVILTYLIQLIVDQLQCIWMVNRPWKLLASIDGIKFENNNASLFLLLIF